MGILLGTYKKIVGMSMEAGSELTTREEGP